MRDEHSTEPGLRYAVDLIRQRIEDAREKRNRFGEAVVKTDAEPLWRMPGMFPEEWRLRLPHIQAFIEQGFIYQWFGAKRGWVKIESCDFAAAVNEYSATHREDDPEETVRRDAEAIFGAANPAKYTPGDE